MTRTQIPTEQFIADPGGSLVRGTSEKVLTMPQFISDIPSAFEETHKRSVVVTRQRQDGRIERFLIQYDGLLEVGVTPGT